MFGEVSLAVLYGSWTGVFTGMTRQKVQMANDPREYRPPVEGKTKAGCERTRRQIKVLRILYLLFLATLGLHEAAICLASSRRRWVENRYKI